MSFYADWDYKTYAPQVLRKDTRIFWGLGPYPQDSGRCIGTFVGENPGSGSSRYKQEGWNLLVGSNGKPGDPTLLAIKAAWTEAVRRAKCFPKPDDYIEVLNLYYFCCSDSGKAYASWQDAHVGKLLNPPAIRPTSRFVILGWGKTMNNSQAATAILKAIFTQPVMLANLQAKVEVLNSPLSRKLPFYPTQPSHLRRKGLIDAFKNELAEKLLPYV